MTDRRVLGTRRRGNLRATCLLSWLLARAASAQGPADPAGSEDELKQLETLLSQETELATKTRMNHDYVPGMVTVLSGDDLEALGVRNVWEALALVPGVQTVRDLYGSPLILVRGTNFIFNSGNIKILVDSVPLNQESAGISSSILQMPIEDVERIELMRGPGSAIHGDFAYLGLLNIVTRREDRRAFGVAETHGLAGGAHLSFADAARNLRSSISLSGFTSRDVDASGPTRTQETKGFGRFSLGIGGFSLSLQALDVEHDGRGDPGGELYTERRLAGQARYQRDLSSTVQAEVHGELLRSDDEVGAKTHDGETVQVGVELRWKAPGRHTVFASVGYGRSEIFEARIYLPPLFDTTIHGVGRRWKSLAIQDQWDVTGRLALTAGVRVDDFNDIGSKTTARFAAVYRLGERQIVKAQYAQGSRSPGFWEVYGAGAPNRELDAETIDTTELSYILRGAGHVGRVTLFRSELRKMIQPSFFPRGFSNAASARTTGVEVEWTQEIGTAAKVTANVSWVDPEDRRFTRDVLAAAEWLANVAILARPTSWLRVAGRWNHVGTRGGFVGTPTLDGYDTIDLTASSSSLLSGLTVRGGVKNVLDDEVDYVTTLPPPLAPILQRYGGRTFWAQLSFRF